MTNEQWSRAKPVLTSALGLDAAARDDLLRSAFEKDQDLRGELARVVREFEAAAERQGLRVSESTTRSSSLAPGEAWPTRPFDPLGDTPFLSPGDVFGHYRIVRLLGTGGMGQVYLAEDIDLGTPTALKLVSNHLLQSADARLRLHREAARAAQLRFHPHIATVLQFTEVQLKGQAVAALAMEYVQGTPANQLLQSGPVPVTDAIRWGVEVTRAIEFAHDKGILHCDLKPANLHIEQTASGQHLKVLDFGISRALHGGGVADGFGTLPYMAPEQLASGQCTAATDIYALGVTLFELITGRRPYESMDPIDLTAEIIGAPVPAPSSFRPGLSRDLDRVLQRAIAKVDGERFASMAEFRAALETLTPVAVPRPALGGLAAAASVGTVAFITFVGFVTAQAFDQGVGLTTEVRLGALWQWFVWGFRSLVAPIAFAVTELLAALCIGVAVRLLWNVLKPRVGIVARSVERVRALVEKVTALPVAITAQLLLLVHVALLLGLAVMFSSLLAGFTTFMTGEPGSIDALRPSNRPQHELFGYMVTTELLAFCLAWYGLLQLRRRRHERSGTLYIAAGVAAACLSLFFFSARFRILTHNKRERVVYAAQACYLIEDRGATSLLFCPLVYPRTIVAPAGSFQRTSTVQSIFTPLDPR